MFICVFVCVCVHDSSAIDPAFGYFPPFHDFEEWWKYTMCSLEKFCKGSMPWVSERGQGQGGGGEGQESSVRVHALKYTQHPLIFPLKTDHKGNVNKGDSCEEALAGPPSFRHGGLLQRQHLFRQTQF